MLTANCQNVFFCPFKQESVLIADQLSDCRKINSQTWASEKSMIFTWNGAGFMPMQKFLDCFPVDGLKSKNIFLFGSAGSVDDSHQPGQIFSVSRVSLEEKSFDLKTADEFPQIQSLTKEAPVLSNILRQNIFKKHASCLIDMESYHFIEYLKKHQIEAQVIRFVSDTPSFPFRLPFPKELTRRFAQQWSKFAPSEMYN